MLVGDLRRDQCIGYLQDVVGISRRYLPSHRVPNSDRSGSTVIFLVGMAVPRVPVHLLTCPVDDIHVPTLTVGQTFDFALSMKAPGSGGRLPGVPEQEFSTQVRDLLLRMLNISYTKSALVGNEFVRGISGGERKWASIAKMMAMRAQVQS